MEILVLKFEVHDYLFLSTFFSIEFREYLEFEHDFDVRPESSADELTLDGHTAIRMKTHRFDRQK